MYGNFWPVLDLWIEENTKYRTEVVIEHMVCENWRMWRFRTLNPKFQETWTYSTKLVFNLYLNIILTPHKLNIVQHEFSWSRTSRTTTIMLLHLFYWALWSFCFKPFLFTVYIRIRIVQNNLIWLSSSTSMTYSGPNLT